MANLNERVNNIIQNIDVVYDGKMYVTDDMWEEAVKDLVKANPSDVEDIYYEELDYLANQLKDMVENDPQVKVEGDFLVTVGE